MKGKAEAVRDDKVTAARWKVMVRTMERIDVADGVLRWMPLVASDDCALCCWRKFCLGSCESKEEGQTENF